MWLEWLLPSARGKFDPDRDVRLLAIAAYADLNLKNYEAARERAFEVLKRADEIADRALLECAFSYVNFSWLCADQCAESVKFFSDYIERHPNESAAYHQRAIALWYFGQSQAAVDDFSRALELNPHERMVLSSRGQALVDCGKYD